LWFVGARFSWVKHVSPRPGRHARPAACQNARPARYPSLEKRDRVLPYFRNPGPSISAPPANQQLHRSPQPNGAQMHRKEKVIVLKRSQRPRANRLVVGALIRGLLDCEPHLAAWLPRRERFPRRLEERPDRP